MQVQGRSLSRMLSSLRSSGPAALRAARHSYVGAVRPAVGRAPLRCMASKGRKKEPEESE
jgi:hypothetical protein